MRKVTKTRKPTRRSRKKKPIYIRLGKFLFDVVRIPSVAISLAALMFSGWFYFSGNFQALVNQYNKVRDYAAKETGLVLQDILLEGQEYTPKEDILTTMSSKNHGDIVIGEPIINIDLWEIKKNLEQLTWVKFASVERQYPSTLSVSIIERKPTALWQNNQQVHLVDSEGEVINTNKLEDFADLIIMVGSEAPSHTRSLLGMIHSQPSISDRVSSAIRVSKRRWNLRMHNGIEIKLPEEEPTKAWAYLAKMQDETKLLDTNVKKIDLRVEDKMFVR